MATGGTGRGEIIRERPAKRKAALRYIRGIRATEAFGTASSSL
jgi:hypothetical protein